MITARNIFSVLVWGRLIVLKLLAMCTEVLQDYRLKINADMWIKHNIPLSDFERYGLKVLMTFWLSVTVLLASIHVYNAIQLVQQ